MKSDLTWKSVLFMKERYLDIQPVCMSMSTGIWLCVNGEGLELLPKGEGSQNGGYFWKEEGVSEGSIILLTCDTKILKMQWTCL